MSLWELPWSSGPQHSGRASIAPLTLESHLWACGSLLSIWVPSHSEEWDLRSPELLAGRASTAPLTIEGHLWACRSLLSIVGGASIDPLTLEGHLWACCSLLSIWVPSHSEEWVLCSPKLLVGRDSTAPLTIDGHLWACRSLLASEFPLILRNEFSALQSSLLVELALLPSP